MLKKSKYIFLIIWQLMLLMFLTILMSDAPMWVYLMHQAKGQLNIIRHTQPIEDVLKKNMLSDEQKNKIMLIQEIKGYAEKELGLKHTNNYSSYFDQQGKPLLWMLTACEPYSFNEKKWRFPLLGDVSYKGFFDFQLAKREANALKMEHYDVDIGKVSAWSTLGILSDPVLSSMLEDTEGEITELIIHELTHATLYFPDNVDFNENFASFVGRQGALKFITLKFGKQSKEMNEYLQAIKEKDILVHFILAKKVELETFYHNISANSSSIQKVKLKHEKLENIIHQLYGLEIYNWKTKIKIAQKIKISGNAYFMSFNRYDALYDKFLNVFQQHNGNMKEFIYFYKTKTPPY